MLLKLQLRNQPKSRHFLLPQTASCQHVGPRRDCPCQRTSDSQPRPRQEQGGGHEPRNAEGLPRQRADVSHRQDDGHQDHQDHHQDAGGMDQEQGGDNGGCDDDSGDDDDDDDGDGGDHSNNSTTIADSPRSSLTSLPV